MKVIEIFSADEFSELLGRCPKSIQKKFIRSLELFQDNPFHPSLRLHKLSAKLE